MNRSLISLTILALAELTISPAFAQPKPGLPGREAFGSGWLTSYSQAKEEARKANKPIMLVFRCVP